MTGQAHTILQRKRYKRASTNRKTMGTRGWRGCEAAADQQGDWEAEVFVSGDGIETSAGGVRCEMRKRWMTLGRLSVDAYALIGYRCGNGSPLIVRTDVSASVLRVVVVTPRPLLELIPVGGAHAMDRVSGVRTSTGRCCFDDDDDDGRSK